MIVILQSLPLLSILPVEKSEAVENKKKFILFFCCPYLREKKILQMILSKYI